MALLDGTVDVVGQRTMNGLAPPAPPPPAPEPAPSTPFLGAPISQLPGYQPPQPSLQDLQRLAFNSTPPSPSPDQWGPSNSMEPIPTPPQFQGNGNLSSPDLTAIGALSSAAMHPSDIGLGTLNGINSGVNVASQFTGNLVGQGASLASQGLSQVEKVPFLRPSGQIGTNTPEEQAQRSQAFGNFVGQQAPIVAGYALAPQLGIPTSVLDAYFAIHGAGNVKSTVDAYNAGQIDGKTALLQLGAQAPAFLPFLVHGVGALADFAKTDTGQAIISKAQEERGGSAGTPPEPPAEPSPAEQAGLGPAAEGPLPPGQASTEVTSLPSMEQRLQAKAASVMPPENDALLQTLKDTMPTTGQREAQLQAGRARQFGTRQQAIDAAISAGKSPEEALGAGTRGMAGSILDQPEALRGQFTEENVQSYYSQILQAEQGNAITSGESIAAKNGLDRLMNGARADGSTNPIMPYEAKALGRVLGPEIGDALPVGEKSMTLWDKVLAPAQLWRSVLTAFDDSFLGRQGGKFILSDPGAYLDARIAGWKTMFARDPQTMYDGVMEQMRQNSPNFIRAQNAERPLGIMTFGGGERPAEEFLSPLTSKIPLLNRSEAMFVVEGNVLRQGALDRNVKVWEAANDNKAIPDEEFQNLIDNINSASLWGNSKVLGSHAGTIGQVAFSARAKLALGQYIGDLVHAWTPGTDPTVRMIVTKRFAGFLATNATLLTMLDMIGKQTGAGSVDLNPLSSNFGQAKFGPQKFDLWGGYSPIARLIFQVAEGKKQPPGYNQPFTTNRGKLVFNYARNQLSPAASVLADATVGGGADQGGNRINSLAYWNQKLPPLAIQDSAASLKAFGLLGIPGSIAAFHGVGVQTYEPSNPKAAAKANLQSTLMNAGWQPLAQQRTAASNARAAYIAKYGGTKEQNVAAANHYDTQPQIKSYLNKLNLDELKFWRDPANKALLKQAWEAGVNVEISDAQVKQILGIR